MTYKKEIFSTFREVREKLLELDGVLGVGIGDAEKGGLLTGEPAINVYVQKKLPRTRVKKAELIPRSIKKIRLDVREPRFAEEQHKAFLKRNKIRSTMELDNLDHFWLDEGKIHAQNLKRLKALKAISDTGEPHAPATATYGEIFVIEDDDTIINPDNNSIDYKMAYDIFRQTFGDHYDFVMFRFDTASGVPAPGNFHRTIFNNILGINQYKGDNYNKRSDWNSNRLWSFEAVTSASNVRVWIHEIAHQWIAFVYHQENGVRSENLHKDFSVPSQQIFHWGTWFDNDNSCMDYDHFDWINSVLVSGEYQKQILTQGLPGQDQFGFHPLDLYLMGFLDKTEVGGFRYIENPSDTNNDGSFSGTQVDLTVNNIIDEEGNRNPAYPDTQRVFHQAYILITKDMSNIGNLTDTSTFLGNMERMRVGTLNQFRQAIRGRGMIDGSLLHNHYQDLYIRDNSNDTGQSSSTGAFWNSPDLWVRLIKDNGTSHQDPERGRTNWIYARVWNKSTNDYDDVTVRMYLANFLGTEFLYPEDWHPDNLIGEETVSVPAGSSTTVAIRWDTSDTPVAHPCLLAEVIPMEITPNLRHHVWDNRKLAQKNVHIVEPKTIELPEWVDFVFGHATRKKSKFDYLVIARSDNIAGLRLVLNSGGVEVELDDEWNRAPLKDYLAPLDLDAPQRLKIRGGDGLSLTFPRDTDILVGAEPCLPLDSGCLVMTVCGGSRIRLRGGRRSGDSIDKLTAFEHRSQKLYRLPDRDLNSLKVIVGAEGLARMQLLMDTSKLHPDCGEGLVRLMQCESDGRVVGGIDIKVLA